MFSSALRAWLLTVSQNQLSYISGHQIVTVATYPTHAPGFDMLSLSANVECFRRKGRYQQICNASLPFTLTGNPNDSKRKDANDSCRV